ncbi:MAG: sulfite exporter TauE/SafE family protein [Clostridiales Family XIII bacterium]|jgi:sulfite exporter TauE/SafE/copper chaperone CopZ|nr:sulfite exporter TauE/SafE family protein [Clostridiales Family XIII bacterium]
MGKRKRGQINTLELRVGGMTCVNCQNRIEIALRRTVGVAWAHVSYADGKARIGYDPSRTDSGTIIAAMEALGYRAFVRGNAGNKRAFGILIAVAAVFLLLHNLGFTISAGNIPLAEEGMGYGLLFLIGLLTSVHCVAMCGGINISQCMPAVAGGDTGASGKSFAPSLKYNLSRVCSYTAIGAVVGGIGSAVNLSGDLKGLIQLIAGVFMVVMGLSMFGVIPGIGRIVPHMPRVFGEKIESAKRGGRGPVVIGLLNGFMPCGPLQAMQLFALSTGSPAQGAISMLCFSLGTVPLMFGIGALSSLLGGRFTSRAMVVGAALVVFLGLSMFTQGLALSGVDTAVKSNQSAYVAKGSDEGSGVGGDTDSRAYTDDEGNSYSMEGGTQVVHSTLGSRSYPHITVKAGTPVRWVIDAPQRAINGCNGVIYIPEYAIEHAFESGENVIEFNPDGPGTFMYSCWMGMITSTITVEA